MDSETQNSEIIRTARTAQPDLYSAALLAPRAKKMDLIVLAAFIAEIERISVEVSEPHLAEIRLQWWRDGIEHIETETRLGHSVLDAMRAVMQRNGISPYKLDAFFDAYADSFYSQGPPTEAAFRARVNAMFSTPFVLSRIILSLPDTTSAQHALDLAGQSYGAMRLAVDLPVHLLKERLLVPENVINIQEEVPARQICSWLIDFSRTTLRELAQMPQGELKPIIPAILPVAVVEPHLRVLQRDDHKPDRDIAEIAPLTRLWRMYWARRSGHFFKARN